MRTKSLLKDRIPFGWQKNQPLMITKRPDMLPVRVFLGLIVYLQDPAKSNVSDIQLFETEDITNDN